MKEKILVVDDDKLVRNSLQSLIANAGYVVDVAKNGEEAESKSAGTYYNVALIDIRLPDIIGIELLAKMKEYVPKTRKIILTGYPDLETAIEAVNKKADGYLVKPFDPETLLKVINDQIREQGAELKYTQEKVVEYIKSRVNQIDKKKVEILDLSIGSK
ncbi:MAG: response regulator [Candidatus Bathyarchaeota archaeon]|nr:response regulator [Candidatus Bathyarchaeota archaeon]